MRKTNADDYTSVDVALLEAGAPPPRRLRFGARHVAGLIGSLLLVALVALAIDDSVQRRAAATRSLPRLGWEEWKPFKPFKPMKPMDDFPPFEPWKPFKPFKPMSFKPMSPFADDSEGAVPMPSLDSAGVPELDDVLPGDGSRLRWGILGPSAVAHDLAASLHSMGASMAAVAVDGGEAAAKGFANMYSIGKAYGSVDDLAADTSVDVVFVAALPEQRVSAARALLAAGKHVLMERSGSLSVAQYDELAAAAQGAGKLFVVNYWTRFFPAAKWALNAVKSGKPGSLQRVQAEAPPVGVQAVCDMVQYATLFLAQAEPSASAGAEGYTVRTAGHLDPAGGDSELAIQISHAGANATFSATSSRDPADFSLVAFCSHGAVNIAAPADSPTGAGYTVCKDAIAPTASMASATNGLCGGWPAVSQGQLQQSLPVYPKSLEAGHAQLHGMGLVYVASAIERCAYVAGCSELSELTAAQQRLTVQLTADVLAKLNSASGL